MKNKNTVEKILEFWPILTVLFLGISAYAVDAYRLSQCEKREDHQGQWGMRLEQEIYDLKIKFAEKR